MSSSDDRGRIKAAKWADRLRRAARTGDDPRSAGGSRPSVSAIPLVVVTVLVIVVSWSAATGAQANDPSSVPQALANSHTSAEIEAAVQAGAESQEPAGEAVEEGADLDRGEALDLMEGDFGGYLEASVGVFDELRVQNFLSNDAAIVGTQEQEDIGYEGTPHGPALLESTVPLRTDSAIPGVLQPVDLSLEHTEGELQPVNPLVEIGIPTELEEGIQIPEAEIRLAGSDGSRVPTLSPSGAAFYPEVLEDTDLAVAPTPTGVETFTQLRSPAAPTEETYEIDGMPAGAELVEQPDGEVKAMEGDQELFFIMPPTAIDAEGNSVPVEMEPEGPEIAVTVHPSSTAAYPIVVDPGWEEDLYHWESGAEGWTGWGPYRTPTTVGPNTYNEPSFGCSTYCYLYASANAGGWIWEQTQTYWGYAVPRFQSDWEKEHVRPTSWISCLTTGNLVFSRNGDPNESPRAISDISSESGGWISTYMWGTDQFGGFGNCTTSSLGRMAAFGLFATAISNLSQPRYFLVGYAQVLLNDTAPPAFGTIVEPSHWVNASLKTFKVTATDSGLGVKSLQVSTSGGEVLGTVVAKTASGAACTGTTRAPCPRTWEGEQVGNEFPLSTSTLPQGMNSLKVAAGDPVGNVGFGTLQVYVDHTKPELSITGSLLEQNTLGASLPQYTVAVEAKDGSAAAHQSGIADVEIKVDGVKKNTEPGWAPGCAAQDCALSKTWTLKASEYTAGKHTLEVVAHDAVGLASTPKTATFEITPDKTTPQLIGNGALVEGPKGWIAQGSSASFHGEVKDPGGYGATSMELKVTGAKAVTKTGTCPSGGCTLSENFKVNTAALAGGTHTVTLVGKDGAGNVKEASWIVYVDPVGTTTVGETTDTLEAMEKTSEAAPIAPVSELLPPGEIAEGTNPSLMQQGKYLVSEGTPVESTISIETEAIEIETPTGPFALELTAPSGGGQTTPTIENGVAAVSANTGTSFDTVTRPVFNGIMQFVTIRSAAAPEEFPYQIEKGPHQTLKQIDPGDIGVFYENGEEAVLVRAEEAWDAAGHQVSTTVAITGPEEIVMTVHHRASGVVYPVVAGPQPVTGYSIPISSLTEPGKPVTFETFWSESVFTGYETVSAPVPVPEGAATASSAYTEEFFKKVLCSHTEAPFSEPEYTEQHGSTFSYPTDASDFEEFCGDPWHGKPGLYIAFREGLHGRFLQKAPNSKRYAEVKHEGTPTESIGCVAEATSGEGNLQSQRRATKERCVWWGQTAYGGGPSATWGYHITPVSFNFGESRGWCGDNCGGTPNPWKRIEMPPMTYYLWADGHYAFHSTKCIDC